MTMQIDPRLFRAAEVVRIPDLDSDDAPVEVEVSFSSETPYPRMLWDSKSKSMVRVLEVLGHGDGEVDLSILNSGTAPVLKDHRNSVDAQVGTVRRAWVEGGKGCVHPRLCHPFGSRRSICLP